MSTHDSISSKGSDAGAGEDVEHARGLSMLVAEALVIAKRLPPSTVRDDIGRELEHVHLTATLLSGRPAERSEAERGGVSFGAAFNFEPDAVIAKAAQKLLEDAAIIERLKTEANRLQQIAEQHQRRNAELETETARQRDEALVEAALVREQREELQRTISALRKTIRERDAATRTRDEYAVKLRSLGFTTAVHS